MDVSNPSDYNIFTQRIIASGTLQWSAAGVAISTATSYQGDGVIPGDGSGGAIIALDDRRGGNYDIYAQRVYANGDLYTSVNEGGEVVPNEFALAQNYPNPFNPYQASGCGNNAAPRESFGEAAEY